MSFKCYSVLDTELWADSSCGVCDDSSAPCHFSSSSSSSSPVHLSSPVSPPSCSPASVQVKPSRTTITRACDCFQGAVLTEGRAAPPPGSRERGGWVCPQKEAIHEESCKHAVGDALFLRGRSCSRCNIESRLCGACGDVRLGVWAGEAAWDTHTHTHTRTMCVTKTLGCLFYVVSSWVSRLPSRCRPRVCTCVSGKSTSDTAEAKPATLHTDD